VTLESKGKPSTADSQTSPCKEYGTSAVSTIEDTLPSPDRSRFKLPACIEVLRNMMITQGNAVGKLAEQVEKIQAQQQAQQGNTRKSTGKPAEQYDAVNNDNTAQRPGNDRQTEGPADGHRDEMCWETVQSKKPRRPRSPRKRKREDRTRK